MSDTLQITDLKVHFPGRGGEPIRAVDGVSLSIAPHETLGLVGESGCGKSTVSNATVGLVSPTSGSVRVLGTELAGANARTLRAVRARAQMVFQDPVMSLNPRMTVGAAIGEPLLVRNLGRGIALRDTSSPSFWRKWASAQSMRRATRINSVVGNASGSSSPGRWPCGRHFWFATSPSRHLTFRSGRKS